MGMKEINAVAAKAALSCMFWRQPNYTRLFADNVELFVPYAPPGMPQYFSNWETGCCFEWLNRTVRSWKSEPTAFYTTPDIEEFWAYGDCEGNVHWGNVDRIFTSQYVVKLNVRDGKIFRVKLQMNPLDFLYAAGRDVPIFHMDLNDPAVDQYIEKLKTAIPKKYPVPENRTAKEILRDNLEAMRCGIRREEYRALSVNAPDSKGGGWWAPPEMSTRTFTPEEAQRINPWVKASSPWMFRDPRSVIHPTDDGHVWFCEMDGRGPANWRGNGHDGHYHQSYFIILETDDEGRITNMIETINPMAKFNATNISIPSFPYYL